MVELPLVGVLVPEAWLWIVVATVVTGFVFVWSDPFRIFPHGNRDARLVQEYQVPANSAVRGKRFVCIINPYSGAKQGLMQYRLVALPLLKKAGAANVEAMETTYAGHFAEIGKQMTRDYMQGNEDAIPDGGVLIFGGDGSVCEFINGVVCEASRGSMDLGNSDVKHVLERLSFCHIPVGSSNGIAASADARSTFEAIAGIIKGDGKGNNISAFDFNQVNFVDESTGKNKQFVDLHVVSWGIIPDHDDLVERKLRWLGMTLKMILAPFYVIMRRKTYKGKIMFKPVDMPQAELERYMLTYNYSDPSQVKKMEAKPGWRVMEGEFVLLAVVNLPWAASDMHFAPGIHFDCGKQCLIVIRGDVSRIQLIQTFLALGQGTASKLPFVETYLIDRCAIEATEIGSMGASGENIEQARFVQVDQSKAVGRYLKSL